MRIRPFIMLLLINVALSQAFSQEEKKTFTLQDVLQSREFFPSYVRGMKPLNGGETYCITEKDSINVYEYKSGDYLSAIVTSGDLIPEGDTVPIPMYNYSFSNDESKMLFATETERVYRYSSKSNYYVYDRGTDALTPLSGNGKQRLADFSPDAGKVAFIRENNLFIKDLTSGSEEQITSDGKINEIINGTTDWVYEEEFGFIKGFHWSPDGTRIAFYRFDESHVKEYQITMWGELYPEHYKYKYPKAGEANSIVTIHVYDLATGETVTMNTGEETDMYIPRIKWTNMSDKLAIQWMNRLQNRLVILLADAATGNMDTLYTETNPWYIDITDDLTFLKDNEHFVITSEKSGFNHIYLYNMNGELVNQVTSGEWVVTALEGIDEENERIFYTSAESSPLNRELYVVNFDGSGKKRLSEKEGNNSARFGKEFKYYVNYFSDVNTPPVISVHSAKGKEIRLMKENTELLETLGEYAYSFKEFFTFTTTEGVELNGWMIKPYDFDPSVKYPVLMYVYGGPGSQTVRNSWGDGSLWYQYLASQGIIVVSVDNRGTGGRGQEFKKMTYLQLGKYETIDQIEAAKYLISLEYVDPEKIGIWGWSYGGYMSALCLTKGADYFDMAVAVAPVTNWRYYDNIYTERFMRTPQENPDGYDDNSPIFHVDKMKGSFLLVHGTADDNVHFQNSVDLVTALVAANKQFETQFYPNSNHGIYTGRNTTTHLYTRLTGFILEHLTGKQPDGQ